MLGHSYFYNASIKKVIAVFGSLFNDIYIAKGRHEDKLVGVAKVPLAYAPRERYLARINTSNTNEDVDIAIKLPRMAFEITSFAPDLTTRLNRLNSSIQTNASGERVKVNQASPYNIGIELNIMSRSQDEALQVVEQILPFFNPQYTLTVKGLEGPESKTDLPITHQSLDFQDTYEGDFESGRRTIIYTLAFDIKVMFSIPPSTASIIKSLRANIRDYDTGAEMTAVNVRTAYQSQTADDFDCIVEYDYSLGDGEGTWPEEFIYDDEGNIVYDNLKVIYK
jgi:hypothetical protein